MILWGLRCKSTPFTLRQERLVQVLRDNGLGAAAMQEAARWPIATWFFHWTDFARKEPHICVYMYV